MTIPQPTHDSFSWQVAKIKQDAGSVSPPSAATDLGEVYEKDIPPSIGLAGRAISGPASLTVDILGPKIPFTLRATVRDDSGGYPGPESDTDYDMGPSNTSQTISLASGDFTLTALTGIRRF